MFIFVILQLQMLGYDISWAAFNIIEVMSSTKFTFKVREGFLLLVLNTQGVLISSILLVIISMDWK